MNPHDLVLAAMSGDDLATRQWVKDAKRAGVDLASLERPHNLNDEEMAVAAGLADMFAHRYGQPSPNWTHAVPPAGEPVYLCSSSRVVRRVCQEQSPDVLRRRNVFAFGADYLDVV